MKCGRLKSADFEWSWQDIVKAVRQHRVVVLVGETGSGKTTQAPNHTKGNAFSWAWTALMSNCPSPDHWTSQSVSSVPNDCTRLWYIMYYHVICTLAHSSGTEYDPHPTHIMEDYGRLLRCCSAGWGASISLRRECLESTRKHLSYAASPHCSNLCVGPSCKNEDAKTRWKHHQR